MNALAHLLGMKDIEILQLQNQTRLMSEKIEDQNAKSNTKGDENERN